MIILIIIFPILGQLMNKDEQINNQNQNFHLNLNLNNNKTNLRIIR